MPNDALTTLRREFDGDDDSFLTGLRGGPILVWDRSAFTRLDQAMRTVCADFEDRDLVERWVADVFYFCSHFVRDWTSHPEFPRPAPPGYYEACLDRLKDLADWFFRGYSPYAEGHDWSEL